MKPQQVLDVIIKPTLTEMNHNTYDLRMLLLATYLIDNESFNITDNSIVNVARNWSGYAKATEAVRKLSNIYDYGVTIIEECRVNKRLACLIACGVYSMPGVRLPAFDDKRGIYDYYRKVYNTTDSACNWSKFCELWKRYQLDEVGL